MTADEDLEPIPKTADWPIEIPGIGARKGRCMDAEERIAESVAGFG
jgi:hypothetical protein